MHPKAVADQVSALVEEIQRGLVSVGTLDRSPAEVGPQPCDHVDGTRPVRTPAGPVGPDGEAGRNPYEDPWYVDYSPFTMLYIGHTDVASPSDLAPALSGLRDHLVSAGWRPSEVLLDPRPGEDQARLVIEAPADGYGLRAVGIVTATGRPRIITYCASPCFRHPDEA